MLKGEPADILQLCAFANDRQGAVAQMFDKEPGIKAFMAVGRGNGPAKDFYPRQVGFKTCFPKGIIRGVIDIAGGRFFGAQKKRGFLIGLTYRGEGDGARLSRGKGCLLYTSPSPRD